MIRRQEIQFWMIFFQELTEGGFHNGGYLDQEIFSANGTGNVLINVLKQLIRETGSE